MRKTFHQFILSKSNVLWAIFTSICPALFCCQFIAFACNTKSFAISIFFHLFFSIANLDGLAKVACRVFQVCLATRVWLNLGIVEKLYVTNIYSSLKFRMQKRCVCIPCDMQSIPCALEKAIMAEVSCYIKVGM